MKRQQRKLNFLITQTELYAHFMARKLTGATDAERDAILQHFDEPVSVKPQPVIGGVVCTIPEDDYGLLLLYLLNILASERGIIGAVVLFSRVWWWIDKGWGHFSLVSISFLLFPSLLQDCWLMLGRASS